MTRLAAPTDAGRAIAVRIAEWGIAAPPATFVARGLGSCVAIIMHAPVAGVGAVAHALLPEPPTRARTAMPAAKCVETAIPLLHEAFREFGVDETPTVRLVGGANMFAALLPPGTLPLGARNVARARIACEQRGLAIIGEDTGGEHGRTVEFDPATGRVVVRSLRVGDRHV